MFVIWFWSPDFIFFCSHVSGWSSRAWICVDPVIWIWSKNGVLNGLILKFASLDDLFRFLEKNSPFLCCCEAFVVVICGICVSIGRFVTDFGRLIDLILVSLMHFKGSWCRKIKFTLLDFLFDILSSWRVLLLLLECRKACVFVLCGISFPS